MLNTMKENESKSFTNIFIFSLGFWSRIIIFMFVTVIVFNMMKFLAMLLQVKASFTIPTMY